MESRGQKMLMLSGKIYEVSKGEVKEFLEGDGEIISCQCKGDYPKELKAWVDGELERSNGEGDYMRMEELRRGKISKPSLEQVQSLLEHDKLFQIEVVKKGKDFNLLERGGSGDYTYLVKYDEKQ